MRQSHGEKDRILLWASDVEVRDRALIETTAQHFEFAVEYCAFSEVWLRAERSDLLAIELDASPDDALGLLKSLHERLPHVTLLAVSTDSSVRVMRASIEAGASDFLSLPLNAQELYRALIKAAQSAATPTSTASASQGEIISIYGVRGGLGATTLAVNLAVRIVGLAELPVALVDLDLQRGDVAAFLNLIPAQSLAGLTAGPGEVDEFSLYGALARHPSGVFVLPAPIEIEEAESIAHDEVVSALHLLRARFRYTIVDTARTLTDVTLAAFELATRVLLITDLSVPSVRAARRTLDLLKRLEVPSEAIDVLITEAIPGAVKLEEAVRVIGKSPLLTIPRDLAAASGAMNTGAPLNGTRRSGLTISITELASRLIGSAPEPSGRSRLRRIFGR